MQVTLRAAKQRLRRKRRGVLEADGAQEPSCARGRKSPRAPDAPGGGWAFPGRMKGSRCLGPFEGTPSHPGGQLETMCCSLTPLTKKVPVASVYLSLYFQQLKCISCWERNSAHFNVKLTSFAQSQTPVFFKVNSRGLFLFSLSVPHPSPLLAHIQVMGTRLVGGTCPSRTSQSQARSSPQLFTTVHLVEVL